LPVWHLQAFNPSMNQTDGLACPLAPHMRRQGLKVQTKISAEWLKNSVLTHLMLAHLV